ncbi:hypothetical protein [Aulosira sp. FACHB-615]|uniref:hypothetical protein n=1 Tax=Aulosira sp. FACHB-615 TaxID=2692777 RepID=UPI001A7EC781|nr:hypothetical protein [Aulosira sp. FACHB-615]
MRQSRFTCSVIPLPETVASSGQPQPPHNPVYTQFPPTSPAQSAFPSPTQTNPSQQI